LPDRQLPAVQPKTSSDPAVNIRAQGRSAREPEVLSERIAILAEHGNIPDHPADVSDLVRHPRDSAAPRAPAVTSGFIVFHLRLTAAAV